ncbi:hypothetical protein AVEN_11403-1 [Araneus ventricosus]|uniref:Pre-C2HC domain-containing protein n=1 Tax=Araneus ventricosus TaxID=182803 RepID=A0A4Y2IPK4_ARAVE|nr:hypothetical protein AVEN_11403-1 [Araneus ventricosus]
MKRSNFPMTNEDPSTKEPKSERGPCNEESNSKNESVKKSTLAEIVTRQIRCLMEKPVSENATENSIIPAVQLPSIMMIRSNNFEAHLQLINEKFGELRIKNAGIFIKLFTDDDDMHRQLTSFLTANNIEYLTPKARGIKVVIQGLPSDMRIQQIKEALIEKDLDVEKIVQITDNRRKKSLPLFKAFLPISERNKKIFNLTDLLNLNVSVERIGRGRLRRCTTHGKGKPEAIVPKCVNCGQTLRVVSGGGRRKFRQISKTNFKKSGTTNANLIQAKKTRKQKDFLPRMEFTLFISLLFILFTYYNSYYE